MTEANPRPTLRTEALFAGRVLALNVSSDSRLIPFDKQANASGRRRTAAATAPVPAPSPSPSTELPGTVLLEGLKRQGARSACWYGVVSRPVPGLPDALVTVPSGRSWTGSSRPAVDAVWSLIAVPAGMPFGDRWAAARYAPVLDFRIDRLSSGRHRESGFDNGKGGEGRKLGSKPRHVGSYDFACFSLGLEKKRCQTGIGSSEPMMLPDQTDDRTDGGVERPSIAGELSTVRESCRSREEDERCRLGRAVCWRLGTGGVDSPRSRW